MESLVRKLVCCLCVHEASQQQRHSRRWPPDASCSRLSCFPLLLPAACRNRALTGMQAELPSGKQSATRVQHSFHPAAPWRYWLGCVSHAHMGTARKFASFLHHAHFFAACLSVKERSASATDLRFYRPFSSSPVHKFSYNRATAARAEAWANPNNCAASPQTKKTRRKSRCLSLRVCF